MPDITPEIVVYRFSIPKLEEYLRLKVARLGLQDVTESSRTLVRKLAVDGLMEDGKEDLLKSALVDLYLMVESHPNEFSQLVASKQLVISSLNIYPQPYIPLFSHLMSMFNSIPS